MRRSALFIVAGIMLSAFLGCTNEALVSNNNDGPDLRESVNSSSNSAYQDATNNTGFGYRITGPVGGTASGNTASGNGDDTLP